MDPVSLILLGLALFFVFKLISVLGTRTGHEQQHDLDGLQRAGQSDKKADKKSEQETDKDRVAADQTRSDDDARALPAVSIEAAPLRAADPAFDEGAFLDGASAAYEMIVEAFAAGDLKSIRRFLDGSVYDAFKGAVIARDAAGQRLELKFIGIENASVQSADVRDGAMRAVVSFSSNQVRATFDADGALVDGDPNRVDLVRDAWTFSRPVKSSDPNWTLVATGAEA